MIPIDADRLWNRLHEICGISSAKSEQVYSVTRQSFTEEYSIGASLLIRWMKDIGLKTWIDAAGNICGRWREDLNRPCILVGSHFDTVPNGGRFDGLTGVMAALEAVTCLRENDIHINYPIEVIALSNEEACQYKGGVMGSRAITGDLPLDHPFVTYDDQGNRLYDVMREFGADPDNLVQAIRRKEEVLAFIELHIEQADVLEQNNLPVGIVTGIAGIHQLIGNISGCSAHAGAVSMGNRRDALIAAAHIACEVEKLAVNSGSNTRGTVGYIKTEPSQHNIIAGKAEIPIDIREMDKEIRKKIFNSVMEYIKKICNERGLLWDKQITLDAPPVESDKEICELHKKSALGQKIPYMDLISYAAHDSMILSKLCPTGMLFVRSIKGLSHCPEEYSTKEDIALGTQVLLKTLLDISNKGL